MEGKKWGQSEKDRGRQGERKVSGIKHGEREREIERGEGKDRAREHERVYKLYL